MADNGYWAKLQQTWPARAAQGLWSGLMAPGNAFNSTEPMTSEQMIEPAMGMAGLMFGGGMPMAERGALGAAGGKLLGEPERIAGAALKFEDKIFQGANHGEAYEKAIKQLGHDPFGYGSVSGANVAERRGLNGFVTTNGRFVDRAEALDIANRTNQRPPTPDRGGIKFKSDEGLMAHEIFDADGRPIIQGNRT